MTLTPDKFPGRLTRSMPGSAPCCSSTSCASAATPLYREDKPMRHVLSFDSDLVLDGHDLPKPVNYWLARIRPPAAAPAPDPRKRPFVVVDPRAGHGPGIGGFKADSEIGVAHAGRPSLLLRRLPARARCPARRSRTSCAPRPPSSRRSTAATPEAEGKPVVIGNCQAGWAVMMAGRDPAGAVRADHHRRRAVVLLGRRATARTRCATPAGCSAAAG